MLPIVAKIFEKQVHSQSYEYPKINNLSQHGFRRTHLSQHGFRRKRSTQTALIKVVDNWLSNIDNGQVTAVVFLDFAKAFDTVKHNMLEKKLQALGITGPDLEWFISYLDNRQQQVFFNDILSSSELIPTGIPQDSGLSPGPFALFSVYQ